MASRFVIFALLITLAFAYERDTSNALASDVITISGKEGRTLEIPIIGTVLFLAFKIGGLLVSPVLSLLEYKYVALSFVLSLATWLYQNYFPVVVGTAVVLGLCTMTFFSSYPVYEVDQLGQAARNLDQSFVNYRRLI